MRRYGYLYGYDKTLLSLSARIQTSTRDARRTSNYVDTKFIEDDLQFNITSVITDILIHLKFNIPTKDEVEDVIQGFNKSCGSNYDFGYFFNKGWLRIINCEIKIPSLVERHLSLILNNLIENKPVTPPELQAEVACMLVVYKFLRDQERAFISKEKLEELLEQQSPLISTAFLLEKKIVKEDDENSFRLLAEDYTDHLRNRIAALLWLRLAGTEPDLEDFRNYIRLIHFFSKWPDDLESCMPTESIKQLHDFSIALLESENDLADPSKEVQIDFLDAPSYHHADLAHDLPRLEIGGTSTCEVFDRIRYHRFHFHDLFDHQETRFPYELLIRFIIQYDFSHDPYQDLRLYIKRQTNPYLIWTIFENIKRVYPDVIPFLLKETELIPIAFILIDKIEIDPEILKSEGHTEFHKQVLQIKNEFWEEAFDFIIEKIVHSASPSDYAESVARVLKDLSKKSFQFNSSNYKLSLAEHSLLTDRFSKILDRLRTEKLYRTKYYSQPAVRPRIIAWLLEPLAEYIISDTGYPSRTGFLMLDTARIDLLIELLRFPNLEPSKEEINADALGKLADIRKRIVMTLYEHLTSYFTVTEISVFRFDSIITATAKRGVGEFGIELIGWAYLFLHFQEFDLIEPMDTAVNAGLSFDTAASVYNEQNKEQREKLTIYVKILMLAYAGIAEKENSLSFHVFNTRATLQQLQSLINSYSVIYSGNDLAAKRIDIFKDKNYWFDNDPYKQSLTSLLYKCINAYTVEQAKQLLDKIFPDSTELYRMLSILNKMDNRHVKEILTNKINQADIDDFIKTRFTVTELESTLIEAVNSEQYFHLADPLLRKIEDHIEKTKTSTPETRSFLFRVKLLLALKRKDIGTLHSIEVPVNKYANVLYNKTEQNRKSFYLALHHIYNGQDYKAALPILDSLHSMEPANVSYAFYLYKTRVLKTINDERDQRR